MDLPTPTVSLGNEATSNRERHSSSFILFSSYGFPNRSAFLASNYWDPISLYQNNVADADSGYDDPMFHYMSGTWGTWSGYSLSNTSSGFNRVFVVHVVRLTNIMRPAMLLFTT